MFRTISSIIAVLLIFQLVGQNEFKPEKFLGYNFGERFTRHHKVIDYFNALENSFPENIQVKKYGETYEKRDLLFAFISSKENLLNLEKIKLTHKNHDVNEKVSIVWLSYNVHGNESAGTEAAMETAYLLLTKNKELLKNTIVIIDPCLNPDGRERYINFYNQYGNNQPDLDVNSAEHNEPWPSGRSNHYFFDLNRDWAWMTQIETKQRMVYFHDWLPHVHVDFHEQGINEPYYFPPAAEPYHEQISSWQRDFQIEVGKKHAASFDKNGWLYFSKEVFDLLYPSYGDTYPMFNGSIGMTYEQAGSGHAGLAVVTQVGDTLTLKQRIAHHVTTGLGTVELTSLKNERIIKEQQAFFKEKKFKYKTFILSGSNHVMDPMLDLLTRNSITIFKAKENVSVKAFNYNSRKIENYTTKNGDFLVTMDQEKAVLATVLLEPITKLSDSLTYDITAWTLPYAFGVNAFACETVIPGTPIGEPSKNINFENKDAYAYLCEWKSMNAVQFLIDIQKAGVNVYFSKKQFKTAGKNFDPGTMVLLRGENKQVDFDLLVTEIANKNNTVLFAAKTGLTDEGVDFGSDHVRKINQNKIGLLIGENTNSLSVGEVWHFFEQELNTSIHLIYENQLETILSSIQTLILPEGEYSLGSNESLNKWITNGGKLIVLGNASSCFSNLESDFYGLKKIDILDSIKTDNNAFIESERQQISNGLTGAIFNCLIDSTNELSFGLDVYHTLRQNQEIYKMEGGSVVMLEKKAKAVNGFVGSSVKDQQSDALIAGVRKIGSGNVVFFIDNPLFRGFWERGKILFSNAIFLVGN